MVINPTSALENPPLLKCISSRKDDTENHFQTILYIWKSQLTTWTCSYMSNELIFIFFPQRENYTDTSPLFPLSLSLSVCISQTANSMLWAIFNLSRNPDAQRKLLEEIRDVVAPNEDPCGEHIKSMPYLKACLKESMRYSATGSATESSRLLLQLHCEKYCNYMHSTTLRTSFTKCTYV